MIVRNHQFDFCRILFATLAHAPQQIDGNDSREILMRYTHSPISFGSACVDGFFLLSGYLIVQAWLRKPQLFTYLRNRFLRIVPGYLVAATISVVVDLVAPAQPYFGQASVRWLDWMAHIPDISYGTYLYGTCVQGVWLWYRHGSPWVAFVVSVVLAMSCGWLSWHLVEAPALKLKRRRVNADAEIRTPFPPKIFHSA